MSSMTDATLVIPSVFHDQLIWFMEHNAPLLQSIQVIVVTSDSLTTRASLDTYLANFTIHTIERPLGFAKTVNIGLRAATTDWIATCNDDVELVDGWLDSLISEASDSTAGLNPIITAPDGSIESAGIQVLPIGKAIARTSNIPLKTYATEALNAACVVYRRTALEEVGYFDERFGSYLEDIDLSLSFSKGGWHQLIVPTVTIVHHRHQTSTKVLGKKKSFYDARNWCYILAKHWSWKALIMHFPGIVVERARNLSGVLKAFVA